MVPILFALLAAQAAEELVRPALPGFVVAYERSAAGAAIIEQVPNGETVEKWTRMVTTQRFGGLASRIDAKGFVAMMAQSAPGSCPGAKASTVDQAGRSAQVRVDCPLNPATGQPETFIARAITGPSDLHVAQVAWRKAPSAADMAWAEAYLAGVHLKR